MDDRLQEKACREGAHRANSGSSLHYMMFAYEQISLAEFGRVFPKVSQLGSLA
jgi:hypothetical protein